MVAHRTSWNGPAQLEKLLPFRHHNGSQVYSPGTPFAAPCRRVMRTPRDRRALEEVFLYAFAAMIAGANRSAGSRIGQILKAAIDERIKCAKGMNW